MTASTDPALDHDARPAWLRPPMDPRWAWLIIILATIPAVWLDLGYWGFRSTEGHRVIPAWEMMERGEYLVPRMFDTIYVRKPPGIMWLFIGATRLFGETELAPRIVSALASTLMALFAWVFAGRWFGWRWALPAGLVMAFTPILWPSARAAEIEPAHTLATMVAVLALIDLLMAPPSRGKLDRLGMTVLGILGIAWMGLTKGPAGVPALIGAVLGVVIAQRSLRPWRRVEPWIMLAAGIAIVAAVLVPLAIAVRDSGEISVREGGPAFRWVLHDWHEPLLLPIVGLATAFPAGLMILFAWAPLRGERADGSTSADQQEQATHAQRIARSVGWTAIVSFAVFLVLGIGNERYVIPAWIFLPVLGGYATRWWCQRHDIALQRRQKVFSIVAGGGVVVGLVLSVLFLTIAVPKRGSDSGRDFGRSLADRVPDGAVVWADLAIESRPEILLYLERQASRLDKDVHVHWHPVASAGRIDFPPPGGYLLLRDDDIKELDKWRQAAAEQGLKLERIHGEHMHKWFYVLVKVQQAD